MAKKKIDLDPEMEFPVEQDSLALSDTETDAILFTEDTVEEVNMAPMDDPSDLPDAAQAVALNKLLAHTLDSGLDSGLEFALDHTIEPEPVVPAMDSMPDQAETPDASIGKLAMELEREIAELGNMQDEAVQGEASNELTVVHEADMLPAKAQDSPDNVATPAQVPGNQPVQFRQTTNFFQTDFKRLDRDLTEPQREEWNAIYASYRARSILTGTVQGVDQNELPIKNPETGRTELRVITSLVVIGYRVKVLIPESEV